MWLHCYLHKACKSIQTVTNCNVNSFTKYSITTLIVSNNLQTIRCNSKSGLKNKQDYTVAYSAPVFVTAAHCKAQDLCEVFVG